MSMRVFVVAGEVSGDKLGGALMAGLRELQQDVSFDGIGGAQMQAQGLTSRFEMNELSVMGIAEILPKYFHLKRRIRETAQAVIDTKPDVLITIDSPDFSLRVAKLVKEASDIRCVHYVAPSVWAWRPGRAVKMAKVIDHVLALLPFEPPYMEASGMECDFVGHPVVAEHVASSDDAKAFRDQHGLGDADPLLLVLPGSRRGEVSRLAPVLGDALKPLVAAHPNLKVVVPAAGPVANLVQEQAKEWPIEPLILDPSGQSLAAAMADKRAAFAAADFAIAASGTVMLELAAAQTPTVSIYTVNWLSLKIMQGLAIVDTANLINLVSDTRHVPEFIGANCRGDLVAGGLETLMADPEPQRAAMGVTMTRLGQGGEDPGLRAARAVLDRMPKA
ncbi:lipid-A-disaccharide synthase [Pseudosulfitobacter sp. SM2401]|uniref:lipid-A-disaccharide synthase n=1 Tax=Pseudosulfitobacter sp. SM2401 TaxID=3350098 RepID=UPI0036F1A7AF